MSGIIVLSLAYVLSSFYRSFLAVLTPVLSSELGMTEFELSLASGLWFATFAFAQFPVGIWLDKYGARRTVSYMHGLFGAGGVLMFATASSPLQVIVAMALIGLGCSSILMGTYIILARKYDPAKFATLASAFLAIGMSGTVIGTEPLAQAVNLWGWRPVSFGLMVTSLITSILVFLLVEEFEPVVKERKGRLLDLLKIRELWPLYALITCSYAIPTSIRALWAGPYLEQVYGLDLLEIGRIVLFLAIAQIVGTIIYGPLDRIFNTRKWVITIGNSLLLVTCVWMMFNPAAPLNMVTAMLVAMALFGATSAIQLTHGKAFIPAHMTGRGFTLLNFFSIGGVAIMQIASGFVVEGFNVADQPVQSYQALFTFYVIYLALALVFYQFSRDAKPKQ